MLRNFITVMVVWMRMEVKVHLRVNGSHCTTRPSCPWQLRRKMWSISSIDWSYFPAS